MFPPLAALLLLHLIPCVADDVEELVGADRELAWRLVAGGELTVATNGLASFERGLEEGHVETSLEAMGPDGAILDSRHEL